jgi:hypothetical protein
MKDYKKIAENALNKVQSNKKANRLDESLVYPEGIAERMCQALEEDLANERTSIGKHKALPEGDESSFTQKIMGERFSEVVNRYKRAYDVDKIDNREVMQSMMPLVYDTMELEAKHLKELEKLAIDMIREEYDMGEDVVEINVELTPDINIEGTKKHPTPKPTSVEFDNHNQIIEANEEVYKRRFLNAMIQGAAKKCNHMFHMVDDELTDIDPRLLNKYDKMMVSADYMYYIVPEMENGVNGGVVKVDFPTKDNPKAIITAQAMVFPVLIHELVKGVMELLSGHGLPKNKKIANFVIDKADFLAAEPWDMRIGPALWSRFTDAIDSDNFHLKHHVYSELAALPVTEFNNKMREILGGTKEGKKIVKNIIDEVQSDLKMDEFNESMNETTDFLADESNDGGFSLEELLGDETSDDSTDYPNDEDNTNDGGWDFEQLF